MRLTLGQFYVKTIVHVKHCACYVFLGGFYLKWIHVDNFQVFYVYIFKLMGVCYSHKL